jgi:AraC-like DNA-binding protein
MTTFHLPHDLLPPGSPPPADVLIRSYESTQGSVRNRLVLHYNMLNLLLDGRKTIVQAAGRVTVYHDELLLMAAGNALTSELLSEQGRFRSILIYFSNAVLADFHLRHAARLRPPGASAPGQPLLTFGKDAFIRHYSESLQLLLATGPSPELQRLKLDELLLYLLHTSPTRLGTFRPGPQAEPSALELRKVVEAHVSQPVTVAELAFLCHMSVSTFQRKFAALYGLSPQQWLLQQRMQLAATLLHCQQLPGEVYQQVGYESHSSFSEAFKKVFGVSPSAFRQRQNGELTSQPQLLTDRR